MAQQVAQQQQQQAAQPQQQQQQSQQQQQQQAARGGRRGRRGGRRGDPWAPFFNFPSFPSVFGQWPFGQHGFPSLVDDFFQSPYDHFDDDDVDMLPAPSTTTTSTTSQQQQQAVPMKTEGEKDSKHAPAATTTTTPPAAGATTTTTAVAKREQPRSWLDRVFPSSSSAIDVRPIALDVVEKEKNYEVVAELPGIDKKDIKLTVSDGMLRIDGERRRDEKVQKDDFVRVERHYGHVSRSLRLPSGTDANGMSASYDNGVLKVTVPKTATPTAPPVQNIPIA